MAAPSPTSYDPFFHAVSLPFLILRPPRLRLKAPSLSLPHPMVVFAFVLFSYFLVVSGFVYDVITDTPGYGSRQDPATGQWIPQVFMAGRLNSQYIIEGLSSGFMLVMGGLGIILLDLGSDKLRQKNLRLVLIGTGVAMTCISYTMSMLFLRIKMPGYLH
eukprot:TRINITY_DN4375_c0_g1_i2.p1 TRINITY_DN4375_c0_g1~~TRINITY_DN4375_c0_g1_i2.p1  ORF type:complete len:181 (+),score=10.44 TRINITY_DN4375_c0_g1_i2:65-544(+)